MQLLNQLHQSPFSAMDDLMWYCHVMSKDKRYDGAILTGDLSELSNQLAQIQESNPSKPEVHFVRYKTFLSNLYLILSIKLHYIFYFR